MNRLILNKATSSNDEPTPGYLYNEISQMAFSSKESMNLVGEYLLKKLQRTDVNVKIKTLKILKHLCDKKRPDFRNFLKKKIDIIKNCQTCNIVHDELKGETPSMLVRKEASDLIKLIYSYDAAETDGKSASNSHHDMVKNNRIQGFGNSHFEKSTTASSMNRGMQSSMHTAMHSSYGTPAGGGSALSPNPGNHMANNFNSRNNYMNKMSGFGNPYFNQNPGQKTKGEIAIQYLNEVANKYIPSSFVSKINKVSASLSKNYANGSLNIQSIMNGNAFNRNLERSRVGRSAGSHQGGGGYGGFSNQAAFSSRGGVSSHAPFSSFSGQAPTGRMHPSGGFQNARREDQGRKPQESQTAGIYERKIIEDVLINAGINKVPAESLLNEFVQKCETLDTKLIVSILTSKLRLKYIDEEENWKNKFKVLCAVRHLLLHRKKKQNGKAIETLEVLIQNLKDQTLEELYRCKEIKHLKKQVMEIFVLIGLRVKQPSGDSRRGEGNRSMEGKHTMQVNPSLEVPNLLDIDDDVQMDVTSSPGNSRNSAHGEGTTSTQGRYPPIGDAYASGFHNGNTSARSLDFLPQRKKYPTEGGSQENMKVDLVDDLIIHFDNLSMGAPPNRDAPQRGGGSRGESRRDSKTAPNDSKLFSSLHVKYQDKEDTQHTCESSDRNFATGQSIQKGEKRNPPEMSSSARAHRQNSNQIDLSDTGASNLIFLENKDQGGNKTGAISAEKNLPHFNEAIDFFTFENAIEGGSGGDKNRTTTTPRGGNNAHVADTKYSDETDNAKIGGGFDGGLGGNFDGSFDTNFDTSSMFHLSKDKNATMKIYDPSKRQENEPFGGNKNVNRKNVQSHDLSFIDMREEFPSLTSDSHFANESSVLSCGKGQVQGYTPPYGGGIMNTSSNPYDQPQQGNSYHMMHTNDSNKSAEKFQSQLTSSGTFPSTDDQIDKFFNSFAISSKRNEEGNKKPSVQIDAFELLADQLKL
ncbi:hypothetical protein C922_00188 [Plasmodium inui San Antonio 1]|uniref:ENTH domain-containing protein n=1 Tax=Plasmodium inui San Antonio 1 TaxID=1237626 RepID=W7ACA3_9APIC|nr:hypothetical protein C922_00188 [Plasmodium inui San Antonio 1]EUD69325.1 hypothetical protein C922_00188 [Plasmodium inui San Antonio 1]